MTLSPSPSPHPEPDRGADAGTAGAASDRGPQGGRTILIVYFAKESPLRHTIEKSLYCFGRYSKHRCLFLNLAVRRVPVWARRLPVELVVFHTTFLSCRWDPPSFRRLLQRASALKRLGTARAMLPQDEYIYTDALCQFIDDFNITHVFSVAPPELWPEIYRDVERTRVRFERTLTGYLDPDTVARLEAASEQATDRPVDIGYRAVHVPEWLGAHGRAKVRVAEEFRRAAAGYRLTTDISTRDEDTLLGDDWLRFLLACKYTIGTEGGAGILDRDGSIRTRTEAFVAQNGNADFETVRNACFPDQDGTFDLRAISPRHLEACATGTCQILIRGRYGGILRPDEHYIPLEPDFGNLDDVLEAVQRDDRRAEITERARRDIVASGRYGYDAFVAGFFERCLPDTAPDAQMGSGLLRAWARLDDRLSWVLVRVRQATVPILRLLKLDGIFRGLVRRT